MKLQIIPSYPLFVRKQGCLFAPTLRHRITNAGRCSHPAPIRRVGTDRPIPPPLKKLSFLKYTGLCGTDTRFPDKYVAQAVMQFPHHTPLFRRKVEHRAIKEPI